MIAFQLASSLAVLPRLLEARLGPGQSQLMFAKYWSRLQEGGRAQSTRTNILR